MARLGKRFWVLAFWSLGLATGRAQAQSAELEPVHRVIEIYDADVVVDLPLSSGAKVGAVVELWRPLKLEHPVTGEQIADEFLIGQLRLTQVRRSLSFARPIGKLERDPEPGDIVILRTAEKANRLDAPVPTGTATLPPAAGPPRPAPPATAATTAPAAPSVSGTPLDADADAVIRLLDAVKGKGARVRILSYESYVRERPNGRYAAVLWEEAQKLRQLVAFQAEAAGAHPTLLTFDAPNEALAGATLSIGVELHEAHGAVLHSRIPTEVAYTTTPMTQAGPGYFVATIAGGRLKAPSLEYFIEAVRPDGTAAAVAGDARGPLKLPIVDAPRPTAPPRHDSTVSVATDYANWNLKKHNDFVLQTEGFVGMRFEDVGLRAGRTGFGVYRGRGGSLQDLDERSLEGREVGLTYGYLEAEAGVSHFVGVIGRGVIGLQRTGVAGGVQAHLRLGNDLGTNLTLGGEVLGTIGLRGITQLELATFPRFPIVLRTEVTNQPAGSTAHGRAGGGDSASSEAGDIGARGIAQVGFRIVPTFAVAARASYQGRTIRHAGPGFGGGVTYAW